MSIELDGLKARFVRHFPPTSCGGEGSRVIHESDGVELGSTLALILGLYSLEGMMAWLSQKLVVHGVNGPVVRKIMAQHFKQLGSVR